MAWHLESTSTKITHSRQVLNYHKIFLALYTRDQKEPHWGNDTASQGRVDSQELIFYKTQEPFPEKR